MHVCMYGTLHKKGCELSRVASPRLAAAASRVAFASVTAAWRGTAREIWLHSKVWIRGNYLVGFDNYLDHGVMLVGVKN